MQIEKGSKMNVVDIPSVPPFNVDKIPQELKHRRQWVCWRYELREGRLIKAPLLSNSDKPIHADVTDPNCLSNFEEAVEAARRNGWGIGFVFFKGANITGIDIDKPELLGEGETWRIIKAANSYAEKSPSGRGFHIFVKGRVKEAIKKDVIEVYSDARFFTVTGNHVDGTPLAVNEAQSLLDELMAKYGEKPAASTVDVKPKPMGGWEDYVNKLGYTLREVRQRDKVLDEYLNGGLAGKPSPSEADMGTLERLLFLGYEPDEAVAILERYRWREKLLRRDYVEGMLRKLLPVKETAEPKAPPAEVKPATEVGETFTFTGDRPFNGRVQVGALATPVSRFTQLRFKCKDPGDCRVADCLFMKGLTLNMDGKPFDPSAWATYFDTNNPLDTVAVYSEKRSFSRCAEWRKRIVFKGRSEKAVTHALIYDLTGREGRAWFIHGQRCDLRRAPNWIIAEGWLCRGYRGRIGVLIQAFRGESEVIAPPMEEVEKARAVLKGLANGDSLEGSAAWKIAELLRQKVNAKGDEVRKGFMGDLLMVASPTWVKTPESGDKELGATTCELGPTTNYKSQRGRFLVNWLGAGKYLRGRKTEAGLTAGLEKVEGIGWVCKKGSLPSADLSFIIVDNADPHALDEQIESRRDGVITVAGIKSMEIWSRCRLKLLNNPLQPFDELVYKCVALKMFDSKFVARFAFALYTYGVSLEERYNPEVSSLSPEEEAILDAARTVLRWNLSQETIYTVPLSLWPRIMAYSRHLEKKYGVEDIPLLLRNIPYKLAVVAYGFALLEGETEPSRRHYRLAFKWLDFCARDIELDKYAEVQHSLRNLSEDEYKAIEKTLMDDIQRDVEDKGGTVRDSYLFRIVDHIIKHGKSRRDELAACLEVDEKTVTRKVNILKGLGLLRSDREGYGFTPKGVQFVKRWLVHVPQVPDVPVSEGQTPSGHVENVERDTRLSPESGDMRDFGDMDKAGRMGVKGQTGSTSSEKQKSSEVSGIEVLHAVGFMATPEKSWKKTLEVIEEFKKLEGRLPKQDELKEALKLYWAEDSIPRVIERLKEQGKIEG